MKINKLFLALIAMSLLSTNYAIKGENKNKNKKNETKKEMKKKTTEKAKKVKKEEMKKLMVINALPEEMYKDCHIKIKGSINVPVGKLEDYMKDNKVAKDTPIIIYTQSYECELGPKAWKELYNEDYKNVMLYAGGMNEWYYKGYPFKGDCKFDYLKKEITFADTGFKTPEKMEKEHGTKEISIEKAYEMMIKHGILKPNFSEQVRMWWRSLF